MEEYEQLGLFEEEFPKYQINKPIRLIELFAGVGSQSTGHLFHRTQSA